MRMLTPPSEVTPHLVLALVALGIMLGIPLVGWIRDRRDRD